MHQIVISSGDIKNDIIQLKDVIGLVIGQDVIVSCGKNTLKATVATVNKGNVVLAIHPKLARTA